MPKLKNRVIVFDLDDTLYLEREFVRSGFRAAGAWFKTRTGHEDLDFECQRLFDEGLRLRIFDAALSRLTGEKHLGLVPQLVGVYRAHTPDIALAPDAERYLTTKSCRVAVISDGPAEMQMAKIRALGIEPHLDHLILTGHWGAEFSKPHPRAYEALEQWARCPVAGLVYVADNPAKDFLAPRGRGWSTIQIVRTGRVHVAPPPNRGYEAQAQIASLDALDQCLAQLNPSPTAPG